MCSVQQLDGLAVSWRQSGKWGSPGLRNLPFPVGTTCKQEELKGGCALELAMLCGLEQIA